MLRLSNNTLTPTAIATSDPCTTGCSRLLTRDLIFYTWKKGFAVAAAAPKWPAETHTGAPYAAAQPLLVLSSKWVYALTTLGQVSPRHMRCGGEVS